MATRMNIQFTENQLASINEMAAALGTSRAGVLRTALALLKVAIRERKQGNQLAFVKDGRVVKEVAGILDDLTARPDAERK